MHITTVVSLKFSSTTLPWQHIITRKKCWVTKTLCTTPAWPGAGFVRLELNICLQEDAWTGIHCSSWWTSWCCWIFFNCWLSDWCSIFPSLSCQHTSGEMFSESKTLKTFTLYFFLVLFFLQWYVSNIKICETTIVCVVKSKIFQHWKTRDQRCCSVYILQCVWPLFF